jgi:hypothetical protein
MFSLIRKGMLLHLQRNNLNSDGFAPNASHPIRKMLVEISLEVCLFETLFKQPNPRADHQHSN